MRKIALLIALTVFGLTQTNAQNFGFKGGYNYSSFNGEVTKDNSLKGLSGFYVGALLELPLGDVISLQPEVIYSRQGAAWEREYNVPIVGKTTLKNDIKLDYLNIPVMAKVNLGPLFLEGGVQFGFLVNKPKVDSYIANVYLRNLLDKDSYNSFDFGVGAGLGVKLNQHFFVETRYTYSLTNVFDPNDKHFKSSLISDGDNFKNSVFSIGLGMKF